MKPDDLLWDLFPGVIGEKLRDRLSLYKLSTVAQWANAPWYEAKAVPGLGVTRIRTIDAELRAAGIAVGYRRGFDPPRLSQVDATYVWEPVNARTGLYVPMFHLIRPRRDRELTVAGVCGHRPSAAVTSKTAPDMRFCGKCSLIIDADRKKANS